MKKKIILHVGLPKTGTSFLQLDVFPNIKNTFHTGNGDAEVYENPFKYLMYINRKYNNEKTYSPSLKVIKGEIFSYIEKLKQPNILFSGEGLIGIPRLNYFNNFENTADLNEIFPDAKIFFVFRRQYDWVESMYNQLVIKEKKDIKINNYLGYTNGNFEKGKYLNVKSFNWHLMYKNYADSFGKKNVLALPYEMMKQDLNKFLNLFYNFFELPEHYPEKNELKNLRSNEYIWTFNPVLKFYTDYVHSIPESKIKEIIIKNDRGFKYFLKVFDKVIDNSNEKLIPEQKLKIKELHAESNKLLAKEINIDLKDYEYY